MRHTSFCWFEQREPCGELMPVWKSRSLSPLTVLLVLDPGFEQCAMTLSQHAYYE